MGGDPNGTDSAARFTAPTLINDQVIADIKALEELAPLHNAPAIAAIQATQTKLGGNIPMVAVFDTVFHRTIPDYAKFYAIPPDLAERHKIHRYGFHGISHWQWKFSATASVSMLVRI